MAAVHQCDFCGGVSFSQPYAVTIDDNKQQRDRTVATFDMCALCHGALQDWRVARLRSDGQVAMEGADASLCGRETRDPQSRVVSLCALPVGHAGMCEA